MRFKSSKRAAESTTRDGPKNDAPTGRTRLEVKTLFKLCKEGKMDDLTSLIKVLQRRGIMGALINQADPSHRDGNTLLHVAVQSDSLEVIDLLLTYGANPSIQNLKNETPAHTAARTGNLPILKYLIENGGLHGILDDLIIRSRFVYVTP